MAAAVGLHGADDVDAEGVQDCFGGLKASGGIVVASDHHDGQAGAQVQVVGEGGVEEFLGLARRIGAVEHVACDEEGVDVVFTDQGAQVVEEGAVFGVAAIAGQGLADVPIGGVEDAHSSLRTNHGGHIWQVGVTETAVLRGGRRSLGGGGFGPCRVRRLGPQHQPRRPIGTDARPFRDGLRRGIGR